MHARAAYEAELLNAFANLGANRAPSLSDDDRDGEYRAMELVQRATAAFVSAIQNAAALSDLRKAHLEEALTVIADAMPDIAAWDEAISNARRGY